MHSAQKFPNGLCPPSLSSHHRQSSNSSIWSSHLALSHSRRHIDWRLQHREEYFSRPRPFTSDNRVTPAPGAVTSSCHTAGAISIEAFSTRKTEHRDVSHNFTQLWDHTSSGKYHPSTSRVSESWYLPVPYYVAGDFLDERYVSPSQTSVD